MQDKGWNCGGLFEIGTGQPLLSMRLLCLVLVLFWSCWRLSKFASQTLKAVPENLVLTAEETDHTYRHRIAFLPRQEPAP